LPPGLVQGKMELVADKEPIIYRNFIAGAGSRAIGVGYPEKVNLAFDANELRLALIWQGAFIDAARHRIGRGEGYEPPLGDNVVKLPPGAPFAFLVDTNALWPDAVGKKANYQMHGYGLDDQRRPIFLYTFERIEIEDLPMPVVGEIDNSLRRGLVLRSERPATNLWFRAAIGSKIEEAPDETFVVDDKVKMKFGIAENYKPLVRRSAGRFELLVPVIFGRKESQIVEEIVW
ncbi:MAG: cytochrome c1, partial [Verrucomicrobia bacterium]|nr:cytochrome c1 [Verrucomicrobiota bacterium]